MTFSCDCEATPSLVVGKSSLTKHRYGCGMFRTDKAEWRAAHALLASLPAHGQGAGIRQGGVTWQPPLAEGDNE